MLIVSSKNFLETDRHTKKLNYGDKGFFEVAIYYPKKGITFVVQA